MLNNNLFDNDLYNKNDISLFNEKKILANIISNGISLEKSNHIVEKLYYKFQNLYNILNASNEELLKIKGINLKKIELIKSIPVFLEYYLLSSIKVSTTHFNKKDLINYLIVKLGKLKFETFSLICLDFNKRFISIEQIFRGTIDSATIYPRDLVEKSLSLGASNIIICHNHPSGIAKPSKSDIEITKILYNAFLIVGVNMLDHLIVAKNSVYSFREKMTFLKNIK